ncbi:little elongation complex subunit 2 [Nerophis ophidion]|uniref:little elongation complex subunit 2 n=1 Tax=Nerophis ophidion TaxID=159077 RepID=UPI002ADF7119|nr:little elongation complex subunit 2 [Nerophis ophidion]
MLTSFISETTMELVWEDPPISDAPFFTKDIYDRYSLAPNIRELWASLQSPAENVNVKQECAAQAGQNSTIKESAEFKDGTSIRKDYSCWDSIDTNNSLTDGVEAAEGCKKTKKARPTEENDAYPQPRLPFPRMSSLTRKQQSIYVGFLMNETFRPPPQYLRAQIDHEIMQFQRYLQDVSKICAEDYGFITQGALQYAEDFLRARLECAKRLPQLYQIHEMTSLTGGTFNPGLCLVFEKQLVVIGSVDITTLMIAPYDAQLATDYQSVSSENPPAKKAKDMHAAISSDDNAEKLCAYYSPHVCVTKEALVTLLDNHGPDFAQSWELPVCVKVSKGKGGAQKKTVFIESPLIKDEITVREKSHIYHEESLKLSIIKEENRNVFHLMTELPAEDQNFSQRSHQRDEMPCDSDMLSIGDLTELETFGEPSAPKTPKVQKTQDEQIACVESASSPLSRKLIESVCRSPKRSLATEETTLTVAREADEARTAKLEGVSDEESTEDCSGPGDSDDERLVIDDTSSKSQTTPLKMHPSSESTSDPSPKNDAAHRRKSKVRKAPADHLGEILRMQTAMFSSANNTPKCQETVSPSPCPIPAQHCFPLSLVKPCVTAYLERSQHGTEQVSVTPVVHSSTAEQKKILSPELLASTADDQDFTGPERGNLLYKLYSLQDLLIMVRTSVSLAQHRKVANASQLVPVHVLPKLEYQLCHGVECLSSSEACQLWTETALHSSNVSFVAHINPHTSKVKLLRKLPDTWIHNLSCGFKPAKSLNILHHLVKKLTKLEEGQYLITHKPGEPIVTFLKAADGKACREAYDLQQVHGDLPQEPASGAVPWIAVDPTVLLPFHKKHGRVPCTFPPPPTLQGAKHRASKPKNNADETSQSKKKKKKKKKNKQQKKIG